MGGRGGEPGGGSREGVAAGGGRERGAGRDDVLFPGERERREYLRDAREFQLRDRGGGDGVSCYAILRGGAYAGRGDRRGESREVGPVVRHRAGGEPREGE